MTPRRFSWRGLQNSQVCIHIMSHLESYYQIMFHMVGLIWFSFLLEGIAEFTGSHLESYHQIMFHLVLCSLFLEGIAEFTCDM